MDDPAQDIIITGISSATPLALDQKTLIKGLLAGKTGISKNSGDIDGDPVYHVGTIPIDRFEFSDTNNQNIFSSLAKVLGFTIHSAIEDAGLADTVKSNVDTLVLLGSCYGSKPDYNRFVEAKHNKGNLSQIVDEEFYTLKFREDTVTRELEELLGFRITKSTIISQCVAGIVATILGISQIRMGKRDFVIVGAFDLFDKTIYKVASENGLLSKKFCKPFDRYHQGTNFSDGAGVIILESRKHAEKRGANKSYAKIDGWHLGNYPEVGGPTVSGICKAMSSALQCAKVGPEQIDLVSSHGTGIPKIDLQECIAFKKVFKELAARIPITSYVPNVGYSFAASTFIDLAIAFESMQSGRIIRTLSPQAPLDAFSDFNYVNDCHQDKDISTVMKVKLSLNGGAAAMIFSRDHQRGFCS